MVSLAELLGTYGIVAGRGDRALPRRNRRRLYRRGLVLAEAAKVVALAAKRWLRLSATGAMASVCWPANSCVHDCSAGTAALSIAAINGPTHTIISGDPAALAQLTEPAIETASRYGPSRSTTPRTVLRCNGYVNRSCTNLPG